MSEVTYEIYHHNTLIGTTTEYLDYKQKITVEGKEYIVVNLRKQHNQVPDRAEVITVNRYDYEDNKLSVGDIVEMEGCFYRIGNLCSEEDKEYVKYLNLDNSLHETNYASYCTKLTYEYYRKIKDKLIDSLDELETAWIVSSGE